MAKTADNYEEVLQTANKCVDSGCKLLSDELKDEYASFVSQIKANMKLYLSGEHLANVIFKLVFDSENGYLYRWLLTSSIKEVMKKILSKKSEIPKAQQTTVDQLQKYVNHLEEQIKTMRNVIDELAKIKEIEGKEKITNLEDKFESASNWFAFYYKKTKEALEDLKKDIERKQALIGWGLLGAGICVSASVIGTALNSFGALTSGGMTTETVATAAVRTAGKNTIPSYLPKVFKLFGFTSFAVFGTLHVFLCYYDKKLDEITEFQNKLRDLACEYENLKCKKEGKNYKPNHELL